MPGAASIMAADQAPGSAASSAAPVGGMSGMHRVLSAGTLALARLPKTSSLVFDIEVEDGSSNRDGADRDDPQALRTEILWTMRAWLLPEQPVEMQLFSDVEDALDAAAVEASSSSSDISQALAATLGKQGYDVSVRTALGGGEGQECLRNLRHTFVTAFLPGLKGLHRRCYVIDPKFKEQFEIGKPTPRYAAVLEALPEVLVIAEANIPALVNFLCAEIQAAFKSNNSVLPPWRHAGSMLTKWMPRKSVDEPVDARARALRVQQHTMSQSAKPVVCEPRTRHVGGNFMPVSAGV